MSKRLGLNLSDDIHAQVKERADAAGVSVHSWIVAAIERESFRQLCQETNEWWAQHPEAGQQHVVKHHQREDTSGRADRPTVDPPPRRGPVRTVTGSSPRRVLRPDNVPGPMPAGTGPGRA